MREGAMGTWEEEGKQVMEMMRTAAFSSRRPASLRAHSPSSRIVSRPAMGLPYPLPPQPGSLGMPSHHSPQAAEKL